MKNKSISKVQILAVLALAMALGLATPSAVVFADGGAAEIETQSGDAETGDGVNADEDEDEDEDEVLELDESIVELYDRIQKRDSFKGYRDSEELVSGTLYVESTLLQTAQNWAQHINSSDKIGETIWAWDALSSATKTKIGNKKVYDALDDLKEDALYTSSESYKRALDNLSALVTSYTTKLEENIETLIPTATGVEDMDLDELAKTARTLPSFDKYAKLYEALSLVNGAVDGTSNTVISAEKLNQLWSESELMVRYNKIAVAALAIDDTVIEGLFTYKLPTTAATDDKKSDEEKPEAPDTGIVGLFESGALDLGTITLIVSVAVASVAGLGLIAKLYLKHKF